MGKHEKSLLDKARDEMFSHIQRCDVLQAREEDQKEWLEETMQYMAERYPQLGELELAQLRVIAERYIAPVIPHGRGSSAEDRSEGDEDRVDEPAASGGEESPTPAGEEAGAEEESAVA